jgi:hypothetical protein
MTTQLSFFLAAFFCAIYTPSVENKFEPKQTEKVEKFLKTSVQKYFTNRSETYVTINQLPQNSSVLPVSNMVPLNFVNEAPEEIEPEESFCDSNQECVLKKNLTPTQKSLFENWNFSGSDIEALELLNFFKVSEPEKVVFFKESGETQEFYNSANNLDNYNSDMGEEKIEAKIVYLASPAFIAQSAEARSQRSDFFNTNKEILLRNQEEMKEKNNFSQKSEEKKSVEVQQTKNDSLEEIDSSLADTNPNKPFLPKNAFKVLHFWPGKKDNGDVFTSHSKNIFQTLQGPDYSFKNVKNYQSEEEMLPLLTTVLSLGHGGLVVLELEGVLSNEPGFDFAVFENAFRRQQKNDIFQEFAHVGVSSTDMHESVKWFPCNPKNNVLIGCAGTVPTIEGGDQFDLSEIDVAEAKYIWIQDVGFNQNWSSKWSTEGADIDAIHLFHSR